MKKSFKDRKWATRQHGENARGPQGHWEIYTAEHDARDMCIVQCICNASVARYLVAQHNAILKELKDEQ